MTRACFVPLIWIAGCSGPAGSAPATPDWPVAATPSITIGTAEAESGHELSTVSGARMQQGVIVVANSGSNELQRFDSAGKLLGFEGRKGQGPGEFLGVVRLSAAPGDSLYVFDNQNLRWSVHDGQGRYARTLRGGAGALASPVWPYRRMMVRSSAGAPVPAWALEAIDGEPESRPGAPPRQAIFDDLGLLWLQDSASANTWTIHSTAGRPVGRAVLPAGFALLQAGSDFVLGIGRDTADLELVRLYRLERASRVDPPAATPSGTLAAGDSAVRNRMFADMNGMLMAQEMFYSSHGAYTANADSLAARLSSGAELALLSGDKRHWVGLLYDRATRTTCAISVGYAPDGWLDGTPFCGR